MKKHLFTSFIVTSFYLSSISHAQQFWGKSEHQMTVQQIKELYPKVTTPPKPSTLANGGIEKLRLTDIDLVNQKFHASFYYKGEELNQVTLELNDTSNFQAMLICYGAIEDALNAKYGEGINKQSKKFHGGFHMQSVTWLKGQTNITLTILNSGAALNNVKTLNIAYQTRLSEQAKDL